MRPGCSGRTGRTSGPCWAGRARWTRRAGLTAVVVAVDVDDEVSIRTSDLDGDRSIGSCRHYRRICESRSGCGPVLRRDEDRRIAGRPQPHVARPLRLRHGDVHGVGARSRRDSGTVGRGVDVEIARCVGEEDRLPVGSAETLRGPRVDDAAGLECNERKRSRQESLCGELIPLFPRRIGSRRPLHGRTPEERSRPVWDVNNRLTAPLLRPKRRVGSKCEKRQDRPSAKPRFRGSSSLPTGRESTLGLEHLVSCCVLKAGEPKIGVLVRRGPSVSEPQVVAAAQSPPKALDCVS